MACLVTTHASSDHGDDFLDSFGLFASIVMVTFVLAIEVAIVGLFVLS